MPASLSNIHDILERKEGERSKVQQLLTETEREVNRCQEEMQATEEARTIIQDVAKATQRELEFHVSDLVSHALATVFDNPYSFKLEFVVRREKTEAVLKWMRGKDPFQPNGGGVRDISALGLRVALWSLRNKKSHPVLILDEPSKYISEKLLGRVSTLFSEISKKLGIQIIMVSHAQGLIESADKHFEVSLNDGVSKIRRDMQ